MLQMHSGMREQTCRCLAGDDAIRALTALNPSALTAPTRGTLLMQPALSQRSSPALSQRLLGPLPCCNPRSHSAQPPRSHSAFSGPLLSATRALTALNPRALTAPSRAPCLLQPALSQRSTPALSQRLPGLLACCNRRSHTQHSTS